MALTFQKTLIFGVVFCLLFGLGFYAGAKYCVAGMNADGVYFKDFKGINCETGERLAPIIFREKDFTGAWKEFRNGKIREVECYKNGKLDGYCISYDKNERLKSITNYSQGKKHGMFIRFDRKDGQMEINEYKDDKPYNGVFEEFSMDENTGAVYDVTSQYENGEVVKVIHKIPVKFVYR